MSNITFTIPSPKSASYNLPINHDPSRCIPQANKKVAKQHVPTACVNCKKAHLACDLSRPCKRCMSTDKADTCVDIQHKKRGRPKLLKEDHPNKSKTKPSRSRNIVNLTPEMVMSSFSTTQPAGSVFVTRKRCHMMTIVLTMDLCCSRVSDESLDFFGLYPQEFSHRSLYDFLLPDSTQKLARIHRSLLDNVTNQHQSPLPITPRSSSDLFFSVPASALLSIANGSLTLKDKMEFRGKQNTIQVETNFYLGGGLGANLFDGSSLDQLYIVCILSSNDSSLPTPLSVASSPQESLQQQQRPKPLSTPGSTPTTSAVINLASLLHQPSSLDNDNDRLDDSTSMFSIFDNNTTSSEPAFENSTQTGSPAPSFTSDIIRSEEEDNTVDSTPPPLPTTTMTSPTVNISTRLTPPRSTSLPSRPLVNDTYTHSPNKNIPPNGRPPAQQFIHPNELYYTQTTSSRLSSEAVAHTAFPYLSTPSAAMCSLIKTNNQHSVYRKNSNVANGYSKYAGY